MAALNALDRHLALTGYMGSGKTTLGVALAEQLGRPFVDLDAEVEQRTGASVAELFAERGEAGFRVVEEAIAGETLSASTPTVLALGGGAVLSESTRGLLAEYAFTVLLEVDTATAWDRVHTSERPLAESAERFAALHRERQPLYEAVADARASDADGVMLAAAGVHVERGAIDLLDELVPGDGSVELVADAHVAGIHGVRAQVALGARNAAQHEVPAGEAAKTLTVLERLWSSLRLERDGTLVALGGGTTTDVAGFAASTYKRGIAWVPVPTTLVGQVDAALGGKTAIDIPGAKNLVGAFHWPARVVCDPTLLETLPEEERLNGMAEVVKTGLLAGQELWTLPEPELVRRCAAYKAGICLRDPDDVGIRNVLNLGHTFAHALEAAAGFDLAHGRAVALGLLAAMRLSGQRDAEATVRDVLRPEPARVDLDQAWQALLLDKKAAGGRPRLVLLDGPGEPRWNVDLPEAEIRAALRELIA